MTAQDFLYSLPEKVDPAVLEGVETVFHFDITDGGQYTVEATNGEICVSEGFLGEPKCVVKAKEANFMGVLSGKLNPMMAVLTGKLKISNQGEMIKYAKIFGLM